MTLDLSEIDSDKPTSQIRELYHRFVQIFILFLVVPGGIVRFLSFIFLCFDKYLTNLPLNTTRLYLICLGISSFIGFFDLCFALGSKLLDAIPFRNGREFRAQNILLYIFLFLWIFPLGIESGISFINSFFDFSSKTENEVRILSKDHDRATRWTMSHDWLLIGNISEPVIGWVEVDSSTLSQFQPQDCAKVAIKAGLLNMPWVEKIQRCDGKIVKPAGLKLYEIIILTVVLVSLALLFFSVVRLSLRKLR